MAHVSAQAERSGRARSATRLRWQKVSTGAGVKDECVVRTSANVPRPGSHRVKKMERCGTRCIAAAFLDFFMSVSVSDTMPRATFGYTRARRRAAGAAERSKPQRALAS